MDVRNVEKDLDKIRKNLMNKEEKLDEVIKLMRELVRRCSTAIKLIHSKKYTRARKEIDVVKEAMKQLLSKQYYPQFSDKIDHIAQEYTEAEVLYNIVTHHKLLARHELRTTDIGYIYGMLDVIGELKREIYESIIYDNGKDARTYYDFMRQIYDLLLPFKFSNALLREFRRKQDVGRIQIEQASSDIIRVIENKNNKKR